MSKEQTQVDKDYVFLDKGFILLFNQKNDSRSPFPLVPSVIRCLLLVDDRPKAWYLSSQNIPAVDFTSPATMVRGGNEAGKMQNNRRLMWSGDLNGDHRTIYQGLNNDVFHLFSRVLSDVSNGSNLANFISRR